jgi:hypothetical protein
MAIAYNGAAYDVLRPVRVGAAFASRAAKAVTKQNVPQAEDRPEPREDGPQRIAVVRRWPGQKSAQKPRTAIYL